MSLAETILAMIDAGCTPEQMGAVARSFKAMEEKQREAEQAALSEKRSKDAARKRAARAKCPTVSVDVQRTECDLSPPLSPSSSFPPITPLITTPPISPPLTSSAKAVDGCAIGSPSKRFDDDLLRSTAEAWNDLANGLGLATVAKLTDARKIAITRRAKELVDDFDFETPAQGFSELFSKIRGSPFLRGADGKWRADFDWVFELRNFTKIMEGKYENRGQKVVSIKRW